MSECARDPLSPQNAFFTSLFSDKIWVLSGHLFPKGFDGFEWERHLFHFLLSPSSWLDQRYIVGTWSATLNHEPAAP